MSEPYRFTSRRDVAEALTEELERLRPAEIETDDYADIVSNWLPSTWADFARSIGCRPPTFAEAAEVPALLLAHLVQSDKPTCPPSSPVTASQPHGYLDSRPTTERLLLLARATNLEEMADVYELGGDLVWADELRLQALGRRDAGRRV